MVPTQSAVIVPVPEVEPVVGGFRSELDRTASWGVPAHVTVVYPFRSPGLLDLDDLDKLRAVVSSVRRFEVVFTRVRWFGEDVVWLAPEPDAGFRELIDAVVAAFPDHPPYGGAFGASIPHLTLGAHTARDELRRAACAVAARLPVRAAISAAHLFQGADVPGSWRSVAELSLGASGGVLGPGVILDG